MLYVTKKTMASFIVAGAMVCGAAPAFAGADEAQQDSFWASEAGSGQPSTGHHYIQMDPRDAKAAEGVGGNIDAANPYYDHAEGTMSTHAGEVAQAPASDRGGYVASYHQYMQMDPRDAKATASHNVDGDNIYFNHAQGTMSGN